jgi:hypothetical protein
MSAPLQPRAPIGSADELREYTSQCLRLVSLYALHGAELADAADDLGLETNLRKVIACVKAAAATARNLRDRI